jgi:hypothetical protein
MSEFSKIEQSGYYTLAYLDKRNVLDDTVYVTYDYVQSSILGNNGGLPIQGIGVTGYKDNTTGNAVFYLFGGMDTTGQLCNTFVKVDVTLSEGGPIFVNEELVVCSSYPPKRMYASMKTIQSYIFMHGGIDELGNILLDV